MSHSPSATILRGVFRASFAALSFVSLPAVAQDDIPTLAPIVAVATGIPTPADRLGSSVAVITGEDIERNQWRSLPDALRAQLGLNIVQTGSSGGITSLFMRGTNANHTKVLIDGIEVSDPSGGGAFDFSQILLGDVERVEVLRGPQSGLYGSDAIGGVIAVTTKRGEGPAKLSALAEAGSFETFNQAVALSGGTDRYDYAFQFGHARSEDMPVTPKELLGPGQRVISDSIDNKTYGTRLGAVLSDALRVDLTARYIDSLLRYTGDDYSGYPAVVPNNAQSEQRQKQLYTRGALHLDLWDGRFTNEFGVGYMQSHSEYVDPASAPSAFDADRVKFDWRGNLAVADGHALLLGLEDKTERLNDSPVQADINNRAVYATYQWDVSERLSAAGSVRFDDNDMFGSATTWRAAPTYVVPGADTRLKASYGTGFKAPSLTQLFADFPSFFFFSNPDLRPEKSRGWDAGFEQPLFGERVTAGATYFRNDITDLIQSDGTTNVNIASATTSGFESFVAWQVDERLSLRADHTFTIARDNRTGGELIRRPKHKAGLTADWAATPKLSLSSSVIYVGDADDFDRYAIVRNLRSDSYTLVNVAASYRLSETVSLFGRVENALDRHYESPIGFERPGFGVFFGLKADLQLEDR